MTCAALALGACSSVVPPRFEAVSVSPAEHSEDGLVLRFTVEATNDNDEPMPLQSASYTLTVEGHPVFTGTRSPEATIRRFGTQRFELPAVIPYDTRLPAGRAPYRITGTVSYLEPGRLAEVLFDNEVRVPSAPLAIGGTIDFTAE